MHVNLFLIQVLLSRDEFIQLSGAQCIAEVLTHHLDYGKVLLRADIAGACIICLIQSQVPHVNVHSHTYLEFMFEALSTNNELFLT